MTVALIASLVVALDRVARDGVALDGVARDGVALDDVALDDVALGMGALEVGGKVALTGVTGTVGSAVYERLLREGAQVRCLVRDASRAPRSAELVLGSINESPAVEALIGGVDVVVHCAAVLNDEPVECRRVNVEGTRVVAEATLRSRALLVHVSTVSVYDHSLSLSADEQSPLLPGPPVDYGRSKADAERLLVDLGARGLRYVIMRPVVVLSMHPQSYWGPLALKRAAKEPGPVAPVAEVPYVHVDNVALAVWLAATKPAAIGRAYNVIDDYGPTTEYLAAVASALGKKPAPLPKDAPVLRYAGDRIRRELGYAPVATRGTSSSPSYREVFHDQGVDDSCTRHGQKPRFRGGSCAGIVHTPRSHESRTFGRRRDDNDRRVERCCCMKRGVAVTAVVGASALVGCPRCECVSMATDGGTILAFGITSSDVTAADAGHLHDAGTLLPESAHGGPKRFGGDPTLQEQLDHRHKTGAMEIFASPWMAARAR